MGHRRSWFSAVAKQVGGVVENRTLGGRGGETFVRVSKEKQKEAVKFLLEQRLHHADEAAQSRASSTSSSSPARPRR